ncbi:hypothetical protein D3C76_1463400 [compost metagenome]
MDKPACTNIDSSSASSSYGTPIHWWAVRITRAVKNANSDTPAINWAMCPTRLQRFVDCATALRAHT